MTDTLWLLAPDSTKDAIRASDTEDSLITRYGAASVTREGIDQGEGMIVPGTVLFAADTLRRLEIQWSDTVPYASPVGVAVVGRAWRIAPGIGLGTSLQELEQMNGGPFEIAGFHGHYSGAITDWFGGRLAYLGQRSVHGHYRATLELQPPHPYPNGADPRAYSAEATFRSSDPGIQLLRPRVVVISVHPR